MSYASENTLENMATVPRVREVVGLLGYSQVNDSLKIPERVDCYMWSENIDYK